MDTISLVSGDGVANLQVTLVRDDTGLSFNAGGADVNLRLRKKGSTAVLATINYANDASDPTDGRVVFNMSTFLTTADEGFYEGEVEVTFADDSSQTVYQIINFRVRAQF
jgi:hypothetical protein|tara:strand:- start:1303 stop:1632 length:330 start_codon:yes stop_codon:yes gene_type:complete